MKTLLTLVGLGLIAAAPAMAEMKPNTGGVTGGTAGRGIVINNSGAGITTGTGSAITGNGRSGVTGLNGVNGTNGGGVIRMNPSVSLDGVNGTNAVNKAQGGIKPVGNSIAADGLTGTNAVNGAGEVGVGNHPVVMDGEAAVPPGTVSPVTPVEPVATSHRSKDGRLQISR